MGRVQTTNIINKIDLHNQKLTLRLRVQTDLAELAVELHTVYNKLLSATIATQPVVLKRTVPVVLLT